ncbi:hypothetical protein HPB52_023332 [Rhipicephalus sanguineus]|uniref:Uncharacterized protein n=1 Tax=Rhipicephalus sanguineus TaxID=34632 RepID=A0A9D4QBA3_RHISA|nr:hypothetical protein HPB52_023332 [Rhipicephalus sanguineus]
MTRCPCIVVILGTGLLISIFTIRTPFSLFWRLATVATLTLLILPYWVRAFVKTSSGSPPLHLSSGASTPIDTDHASDVDSQDTVNVDLPPDHSALLAEQTRTLRRLLREPPSEDSWAECEAAWSQAVEIATEAVRLRPLVPGRPQRHTNPANAADIQRLYKRNRRRAVRLILEGPSTQCAIPLQELCEHWGTTWYERNADTSILFRRTPAPNPADTTPFATKSRPWGLSKEPSQYAGLRTEQGSVVGREVHGRRVNWRCHNPSSMPASSESSGDAVPDEGTGRWRAGKRHQILVGRRGGRGSDPAGFRRRAGLFGNGDRGALDAQ